MRKNKEEHATIVAKQGIWPKIAGVRKGSVIMRVMATHLVVQAPLKTHRRQVRPAPFDASGLATPLDASQTEAFDIAARDESWYEEIGLDESRAWAITEEENAEVFFESRGEQ